MSSTIADQSVVVAVKDQVSCDLAGEAAILNMKSGVYYGLDPSARAFGVWCKIRELLPRFVAQSSMNMTSNPSSARAI